MPPAVTDRERRARRGRPWRGPLPLLGSLLALYLLVPIAVLLGHLAAAGSGVSTAGVGSALWVSLLSATIATAVIAVLGIPLAWVLAQERGRFWRVVGVAVQLPLALPPLMSGILLVEVLGPYTFIGRLFGGGLTDTTTAIVLAQIFVASPFLIVAARSAFSTVDGDLVDVAATLGHGGWSRFVRVSLPLAAPGIRAGLLLAWLRAFGEFGATVIVAYHPYSLPVFTFVQFTSTGLASTLAPTGIALAAAAGVLTLAQARPGRRLLAWGAQIRRVRARPTSPPAPARTLPRGGDRGGAPLAFALRDRAGDFELDVAHAAAGARLAVLGPSGAGKSMILRCLAGLRPGAGRVRLGDRDLGVLRAEDRRVGWVPQEAALLPHLTVWRQATFGVDTDPALAAAWLDRLGLSDLRHRLPQELSGGQRQRVALARALARAPDLLLLDEPFSSLDTPVRAELRREVRRLQRDVALTTVVVTHDPEEAALLADEIVIVADGRVLQSGATADVFGRPRSERVAELLGIDNLRRGEIVAPGRLACDGTELAVGAGAGAAGSTVSWCIRAEHVTVTPGAPADLDLDLDDEDAPAHPGEILEVFDLGVWRELTVRLDGGLRLTARALDAGWLAAGARCRVSLSPAHVTTWSASGSAVIAGEPAPVS